MSDHPSSASAPASASGDHVARARPATHIAISGDAEDDFDTVFAQQKRRLYAIAYSVLRDAGEAEDAVQETMWRAWKSWSSLREPSKREAWITRICLNHCFRTKRKLVRITPSGQDDETGEIDNPWTSTSPVLRAAGAAGRAPIDVDLDRAFIGLPVQQRAAVLLHYHYGYTVEQCAELMGCRSGTVRTHVQRALARLREELGDERTP